MRRMFSTKITEKAAFLRMPLTTQALYFHLGINADDDGIVEAFKILRMTGANEDDLKVLATKQFIKILNEDLVAYILDWNEHNLIRADRKQDSIYQGLLIKVLPEVEIKKPIERADVKKKKWTSTGQPMDCISKDKLREDKLSKDNISKELLNENTKKKLIEYLVEKGMNKELVNQELEKFIAYWTEKNHTGTKERWQMEKTFEVKKRLTTWFSNINKFGGKNGTGKRLVSL